MKKIILDCEYIQCDLRGHFELELDNKEFETFQTLSKKEQLSWIRDGELIVDMNSYSVNDYKTQKNFIVLDNETN